MPEPLWFNFCFALLFAFLEATLEPPWENGCGYFHIHDLRGDVNRFWKGSCVYAQYTRVIDRGTEKCSQ